MPKLHRMIIVIVPLLLLAGLFGSVTGNDENVSLSDSPTADTTSSELQNGSSIPNKAYEGQSSSALTTESECSDISAQESSGAVSGHTSDAPESKRSAAQSCMEDNADNGSDTSGEETAEQEIIIEIPHDDNAYKAVGEILSRPLQNSSGYVDVTTLYQYPELPTGCESVSLTMVLNYFGEALPLTKIASDYLIYGDDMAISYVGDPFSNYGAGTYPPGLIRTAQNYIDANQRKLAPVDTTGTGLSDLYKIIDSGYPVILWSTIHLNDPYNNDDEAYVSFNGVEYWWYTNEHCIVLSGYDLDNGTVTVNDPVSGYMTYYTDRFESIFDEIGRLSIVLVPTDISLSDNTTDPDSTTDSNSTSDSDGTTDSDNTTDSNGTTDSDNTTDSDDTTISDDTTDSDE